MKLPQLSLREWFLLVALAALGCSCWLKHRQALSLENQCRTLRQECALVRERLNECNSYLNKVDPTRDDPISSEREATPV